MIRRAAAVVALLTLNSALVSAQDMVFTVTVQSADVYKGPTNITPVIGHAPRGTVLTVSRNLGSWTRVAWPDAPDGIGYVHITAGRLTAANGAPPAAPTATPSRLSAGPGPATAPMPSPNPPRLPREQMAVSDQATGAPISHMLGIGGQVSSTRSFGATVRAWHNDRIGFQFALTRDETTSDLAAGRVRSMQAESGVVFSPFDHVSDYIWIRPYAGSALTFHHQSLKVSSTDPVQASDNGFGFRVFGGSELTFASLQRFGLSVEVGYRRVPTPFPGFEPDTFSASLAGHWYVK